MAVFLPTELQDKIIDQLPFITSRLLCRRYRDRTSEKVRLCYEEWQQRKENPLFRDLYHPLASNESYLEWFHQVFAKVDNKVCQYFGGKSFLQRLRARYLFNPFDPQKVVDCDDWITRKIVLKHRIAETAKEFLKMAPGIVSTNFFYQLTKSPIISPAARMYCEVLIRGEAHVNRDMGLQCIAQSGMAALLVRFALPSIGIAPYTVKNFVLSIIGDYGMSLVENKIYFLAKKILSR